MDKFDDLRNFVDSDAVRTNLRATHHAAEKLVKTLVGSIKSLKEASEDAAGDRYYLSNN